MADTATTPNGYDDLLDRTNGHDSADDEDLFGDDGEDAPLNDDLDRKLDDSELDSGDDEDRNDRVADTVEDEDVVVDHKELRLMNAEVARVKYPEGDDLYLLNLPSFLGLKHKNFDPPTYEAPTSPHDGKPESDSSSQFSPFNTAASTIYWRRDPKNTDLIQSNARIIRWSDGSLTMQIASTPKDQYRISTTALRQSFGRKHQPHSSQNDYDPNKDSQNYFAVSHNVPGIDLQIIRPLDAAMKIQPTGTIADESVLKLQQTLAAAVNQVHDPLATLKKVKEDPELAKRAAEMFEKDRMRTARKREAAEDRLLVRKDRVLGRSGFGRSGGVGLSVAGLEDDDGMPTARGTKSSKMQKRRSYNRRGDIYSDDEDENEPRRRTKEDEYDREDDFLASSDEEPETYDDDEGGEVEAEADDDDPDVDDLEIEGRDTVVQNRTRGGDRRDDRRDRNRDRDRIRERDRASTPKRALERSDNDDDDAGRGDAGGSGQGTSGTPQARKKRRVIDDDDEDE